MRCLAIFMLANLKPVHHAKNVVYLEICAITDLQMSCSLVCSSVKVDFFPFLVAVINTWIRITG